MHAADSRSHPTVTLVFVTRNEAPGVRHVLPRVPRQLFDDCFAIDGHSTDGTAELFEAAGVRVYRQRDKGLGAAMLEAREHVRTDSFVFFHPDGNEDPADLTRMCQLLRAGSEFVVASRMRPGAVNEEDGKLFRPRKLANRVLALLANLLFARAGNRTSDVTNGFRGVRCGTWDRMRLTSRDLTLDFQMVIRALKLRIPITEFPTHEHPRVAGETHFASLPTGLAELKLLVREMVLGLRRVG